MPHVLLDQRPAPNPKPVKPSDGPLLTKYLRTTAPPPVCEPDEAVPEILAPVPATAGKVY